jgi:hypothetical protein
MLKTVSSVANALGALNYKGTWDAATNTPTLSSGVGTQGDYYVVSVAGVTDLDGITNWGVGDWATFNGSVWQRVEGGADGNFVNLDVTGTATFDGALDINSDINLPDNKKITFGDGNDLELYHSGSHSIIKETGTGQMRLQASTNVQIWNENATKLAANFNGDTQTSLYYGGNDKLTTAATGISINGNVIMLSGNGIDFSATSGTGTSELLSDYEEGVWTPTYTTSGTDFDSVTYGIQTGSYVKIGELVTVL